MLSAGHTRLPSRAASSSWTRRPCSASSAFAFLGLLGQPLRFPGSPAAYEALYQVTDAELLGRATVWAGSEPAADGEVYNVTNGDQLRWRHLWRCSPRTSGCPTPSRRRSHRPGRWPTAGTSGSDWPPGTTWSPSTTRTVVGWEFGEFILISGFDNVSSTIKLRRAGFAGCLDTGPVRGRRAACPRTE